MSVTSERLRVAAREAETARSGKQEIPRWHRRSLRQVGLRLLRAVTWGCQLGSALAILGYVAIDFTGYLYTPDVFSAPHVTVQGNTRVPSAELLHTARLAPSIHLWAWSLPDICARAELHPRIAHARVEREFPDGLTLIVEERTPVALLLGDPLLEIDADGVVLGAYDRERTPPCPVLTGHNLGYLPPGTRVEAAEVREALDVIRSYAASLAYARAPIAEVALGGEDGPVLWLRPGVRVPYGEGVDTMQWARLEAVLNDLRARGTGLHRVATIDLRFAHIVPVRLRTTARG